MLPSNYKLGRKPAKHDYRIPMLSSYTAALPSAPVAYDWTNGQTEFGMLANDSLGDCTAAALFHQEQIWTSNCGNEFVATDAATIAFYSDTCGYKPNDPSTDEGGNESDILKQWLATPNLLAGHSLTGFAAFRPSVQSSMRDSIWLLGGAYLGLNLPQCIENQGSVWQVPASGPTGSGEPGSLGGHAVVAVAYNERVVTIISWGSLYQLTWDFITTYCEEAYALVSADWINSKSVAPSGFDLAALKEDMTALAALSS